ncbi:MAG: permease [Spirochaetes bacterium]|nr:permease [Spirochaetota bacterium]
MKSKKVLFLSCTVAYALFIGISFYFGYHPGRCIANNFYEYTLQMIKVLPFAFILIGLFEVWVKKETVEKHLGETGGWISFFWAMLLGGSTIGPMLVSLPIAHALYQKGARLSVIFTYIGAASICRIPMTIFEASYLGVKFTIIRYAVSLPLVVISSIIMGNYYQKKDLKIQAQNKQTVDSIST